MIIVVGYNVVMTKVTMEQRKGSFVAQRNLVRQSADSSLEDSDGCLKFRRISS